VIDKLLCESCACKGGCSLGPVAKGDYCKWYKPEDDYD